MNPQSTKPLLFLGIDNGNAGGSVLAKADRYRTIPIATYAHRSIKKHDGGNHFDAISYRQWIVENVLTQGDLQNIGVILEEPAKGQGNAKNRGRTTAQAIAVSSMAYAYTLCVLEQLGFTSILTVPALTWMQKIFSKDERAQKSKPSVDRAIAAFPAFDWRKSTMAKIAYDGITDAYMLTLFGLRYWDVEFSRRETAHRKKREKAMRKRAAALGNVANSK